MPSPGLIAINERTARSSLRALAHVGAPLRRRARRLTGLRALLAAACVACALVALPVADSRAASGTPSGAPSAPAPTVVSGHVVRVFDGDSLLLRLDDGETRGIRIAGIDAPEKGQPHADLARRALLEQLHGRDVRVDAIKTDRFDRLVGRVFVAGRDVGLAQLRAGLAWHFKRYDADLAPPVRRRYAQAEQRARLRGIGLWRDPAPLPPWEHRARMRGAAGGSAVR